MVKVIGAGFGRTGTTSLKAALEYLGFGPCYHMFDVIAEPKRIDGWSRAVDGDPVDWDAVFDGYQATVDWPGCTFWRELVSTYPDAKVILTVRDAQRWYESTYNSIYQLSGRDGSAAETGEDGDLAKMVPTLRKLIWDGTFGGRFDDAEHAQDVFRHHNDAVRAGVDDDRLLVYEVSQGWQPLCEFLGVDVPDVDFPRMNDRQSLPDLVERVRAGEQLPSPLATRH